MNGKTNSCGCLKKEAASSLAASRRLYKTHSDRRIHRIWVDMHRRCEKPGYKDYTHYGSRGIAVCSEWDDFQAFKEWAFRNGYKDGLSIDRINVNGNYSPDNCRWADSVQQANNKRNTIYINYQNKMVTISFLSKTFNIDYHTLYARLKRGMSVEKALTVGQR